MLHLFRGPMMLFIKQTIKNNLEPTHLCNQVTMALRLKLIVSRFPSGFPEIAFLDSTVITNDGSVV